MTHLLRITRDRRHEMVLSRIRKTGDRGVSRSVLVSDFTPAFELSRVVDELGRLGLIERVEVPQAFGRHSRPATVYRPVSRTAQEA